MKKFACEDEILHLVMVWLAPSVGKMIGYTSG